MMETRPTGVGRGSAICGPLAFFRVRRRQEVCAMDTAPAPRWIGPSEAARLLGLSLTRCRRLADSGALEVQRTGLGRALDRESVLRLAEARRRASDDPPAPSCTAAKAQPPVTQPSTSIQAEVLIAAQPTRRAP